MSCRVFLVVVVVVCLFVVSGGGGEWFHTHTHTRATNDVLKSVKSIL